MNPLPLEIATGFGQGEAPDEGELVLWDGFDQMDKEDAVRFYSGKAWPDVLAHLRSLKDRPVFGGTYFLEEWSVLTPPALAYYARAHLEFLLETLAGAQPDEEFIFSFLGQLHQVVHTGSPFHPTQTNLLRRVVEWIGEKAAAQGSFEYYGNDIMLQAGKVLARMKAHDS